MRTIGVALAQSHSPPDSLTRIHRMMTCFATFLLGIAPILACSDLDLALQEFSVASIESDVEFLACEELEGRGTPSLGLATSALYIKARLERLGYQPGARSGYFHEYPLISQRINVDKSFVNLGSASGAKRLEFGSDYFFRTAELAALDLQGEVISIGDGSSRSLAECDVEGRWALLLDTGKTTSRAVRAVHAAGGIGVVFVAGEDYTRKSYQERFAPTVRAMIEGGVMQPDRAKALSSSILPRLWLSETALQELLDLSNPFDGGLPPAGTVLGVDLHELRVPDGAEVHVRNVCGFLPGTNPELARETLVISAHYDHLGRVSGVIHPGADDNASGTAGLLALAAALKAHGAYERSIMLLWVSGEEKGLWGSEAWAKDAWLPEGAQAVANINLDMIGRTAVKELYVTPSRAHPKFNGIAELVYELASLEGFDSPKSQDQYWRSSDHFNFSSVLGLPVAYLSSGDHDDYHESGDTADKVDCEKITRVARLVLRMIDRLQTGE